MLIPAAGQVNSGLTRPGFGRGTRRDTPRAPGPFPDYFFGSASAGAAGRGASHAVGGGKSITDPAMPFA